MKVKVKAGHVAYYGEKRRREGSIINVDEKRMKKVKDAAEAKLLGLKVGDLILPKWAEPVDAPKAPEPRVPGTPKPPEDDESESDPEAPSGQQKVL